MKKHTSQGGHERDAGEAQEKFLPPSKKCYTP
ncbi:hypothetical protein CGMCC3_g14734 [Colletotrichum fructicola]|nr:uncharacterized protein CGMCC3_g14734 [Colletotrichum fructicola]KAE9569105.1 hypothetical protein CGMCC3_g14734 [Colletotrichum fructicola]